MTDADLAQEIILDHDTRPRNFGVLERPALTAEAYNPLCGDKYRVFLQVKGGRIRQAQFHGFGCALSKAATSMITEMVRGLTPAEALDLLRQTGRAFREGDPLDGSIGHLLFVRDNPARVRCALLTLDALTRELEQAGAHRNVTTR